MRYRISYVQLDDAALDDENYEEDEDEAMAEEEDK